ncbi:MAG: phage tail protein [Mycobacteriaceae bacterium]
MAVDVGDAFLNIVPSMRNFGRTLDNGVGRSIDGSAKKAGSRFGKVFAYASMSPLKAIGAAAVGLFAIQKVKEFFTSAISEARESQKVSALTAQVIKSTGGAAGISAKQVGNLATSISNMTGIDDEAIQSGENLLLTFTNIKNGVGKGNDIFNQATQSITDMSAALGQDMKSSAIQLGKALNDPIKGVTALSRVGVSFTEGQKATIKSLVDGGHTMDAQKLILGELNKEFGGAAAASATAGEKFKTTFANFEEAVGTALLPYLDKALTKGTEFVSFLTSNMGPAFATVKAAVEPLANAVGSFVSAHLQPFLTLLSGLGGAALASFAALLGGTIVSAIVALGAALVSPIALVGALAGAAVYAYTHFSGFRTTVDGLVASLKANLMPVLQAAANTFQTVVLPAILSLVGYVRANFLPALQAVANVITGQVLPIFSSLAQFVYGRLYPAIFQIVIAVAQKLKPVFDQLVASFQSQVLPTLQKLLAKFREWQPTIQTVVLVVVKIIGKILEFAAAILGKVLPVAIRFQVFLATSFVKGVIAAIGVLVKIVQAVIKVGQQFVDGAKQIGAFAKTVAQKIADVITYVRQVPGKVKAALGNAKTLLVQAGRDIIAGLVNGIKDAAHLAADAAKNAVRSALDGAKGLLGIHSPSTKFAEVGMWSMKGLAKGIDDNSDGPAKAIAAAVKKMRDRLTAEADKLKGILDGLKSNFDSISSSVQSAFAGTALDSKNEGSFFQSLFHQQATLQRLRIAFNKLLGWGVDPKFLSQLFQSGNTALIFDLAGGSRRNAVSDAQMFGANQRLAAQLGGAVAQADVGPKIDRTNHLLEQVEAHLRRLPKNIGHHINGAASNGHRQRVVTT